MLKVNKKNLLRKFTFIVCLLIIQNVSAAIICEDIFNARRYMKYDASEADIIYKRLTEKKKWFSALPDKNSFVSALKGGVYKQETVSDFFNSDNFRLVNFYDENSKFNNLSPNGTLTRVLYGKYPVHFNKALSDADKNLVRASLSTKDVREHYEIRINLKDKTFVRAAVGTGTVNQINFFIEIVKEKIINTMELYSLQGKILDIENIEFIHTHPLDEFTFESSITKREEIELAYISIDDILFIENMQDLMPEYVFVGSAITGTYWMHTYKSSYIANTAIDSK